MPKISIIISTYNRPEKLKRAIESVQAQTFTDWELIVVHDEGLQTYRNDPNSKISHVYDDHFGNDTRPKNTGIKAATGQYIAFLDDDNTWREDHLQILVKALDDNPQVAMVYGDRWVTNETTGKRQLGIALDFQPAHLAQQNYIDTSDVLVRREALFSVGGFDERYKKYVDWNLWLRMEKYGYTFKRIPLIITDYYINSDGKSAKTMSDAEKKFLDETGGFKNLPDWNALDLEIELPYLGPVKEPKVAIFSLTYDRLKYTKACFQSLRKTAGYEYDHFVVDNGSKDGTAEWLEKSDAKHIHYNGINQGISRGSNQALEAILLGEYDIIVKVDNDCFFETDGWLAKMVEIWKSNHLLAMSPYINGLRDNPGGAMRVGYGEIKGELVGWTQHLGGICVFADAKAYKDFRWDEDSFLHGAQDLEFSQHLLEKGFQPCYLENYFASHYEGTEGQEKAYPEYFERRKKEKTMKREEPKNQIMDDIMREVKKYR